MACRIGPGQYPTPIKGPYGLFCALHGDAAPGISPVDHLASGTRVHAFTRVIARIAIIGKTSANPSLLRLLLAEAGVASDKIEMVQYGTNDLAAMAQDSRNDAFMAVGPLQSKVSADAIALTARSRGEPHFLSVDVSEAIAQKHPAFESAEIPGSTFSTSPARPDDKIETVSVDHLVVAPKSLAETTVVSLTRQMFVARPALLRELPGIATLEKPNTDKDATIPAHRGAAAYIDGTDRTFLERYSDFLWGGLLLLSGLGSGGHGYAAI